MMNVETHTGLKITVVISEVSSIHELPEHSNSNTVIKTKNGERIFVSNFYEDVTNQYNDEMGTY